MLIRRDIFPPGGFLYVQQETRRRFPGMIAFYDQVADILGHRKGNKLARSSMPEVELDLDAYTCQRLGNDERWCMNGTKAKPAAVVKRKSTGCGACGGKRKAK